MTTEPYDRLAEAYEWLVPEPLLIPEGTVAAFSSGPASHGGESEETSGVARAG